MSRLSSSTCSIEMPVTVSSIHFHSSSPFRSATPGNSSMIFINKILPFAVLSSIMPWSKLNPSALSSLHCATSSASSLVFRASFLSIVASMCTSSKNALAL